MRNGCNALNEGRGVNPGDTGAIRRCSGSRMRPLNEGRGVNPGDTPAWLCYAARLSTSLNEGRGVNPGDTRTAMFDARGANGTLNEGRGVNPGDTSWETSGPPRLRFAQRRPGREPRRHSNASSAGDPIGQRSTKAGA